MIRSILGVFIGLIVAFVTVAVVEVINLLIFPPPAGFDVNDQAALAALIAEAPAYKLVLVPVAWFLAAVTGGWVAARPTAAATPSHCGLLIAVATRNSDDPAPGLVLGGRSGSAARRHAGGRTARAHRPG